MPVMILAYRGPAQVVGDTTLGSRALPANTTIRARTKMKVLLVRRADAAALKHQPVIKAALYRTQTESSVLDVLESFATFDSEVTAIDDLRKSLAAASSSYSAAAQLSAIAAASGYSGSQSMVLGAAGGASSNNLGVFGAGVAARASAQCSQASVGLLGSRCHSPSFSAAALSGAVGSGLASTAANGLGYNPSSFSALGMLRPASRGNSFTAAAAAAAAMCNSTLAAAAAAGVATAGGSGQSSGVGNTGCSGYVSPPNAFGLSRACSNSAGSCSMDVGVAHSCSPSRGSSSTRFAVSAASSSIPMSREISPVPTGTAAALAAAARDAGLGSKEVSERVLLQRQQRQQQQ